MYRPGAVGALLDIYEQAIADFIKCISAIPDDVVAVIVDRQTSDENCRSVQTVLAHVVHAGYGYANSIHNLNGHQQQRPDKTFHQSIELYIKDLEKVFRYTETVFKEINDEDLEQPYNALKIKTSWGQVYDIEQLMEHAIVHILRHKRQIEKIKSTMLKL